MELLNFMLMNLQIQSIKSVFKIIVMTFVGQNVHLQKHLTLVSLLKPSSIAFIESNRLDN